MMEGKNAVMNILQSAITGFSDSTASTSTSSIVLQLLKEAASQVSKVDTSNGILYVSEEKDFQSYTYF